MTGTKPSLIVGWLSGRDRVSPWPRRATRTFRRARPAGPVAGAQEACHRPAPHRQLAHHQSEAGLARSSFTRVLSTGRADIIGRPERRSVPHQVVPGGGERCPGRRSARGTITVLRRVQPPG